MKPIFHAIAGTLAMLIIFSFWISTLVSELFLDYAAVTAVKQAIIYALFILIPIMASTGGSGYILGQSHKGNVLVKKKIRMKIIAINGFLVMIPAAIFLNNKATVLEFDAIFYTVQVVELIVGAVQLTLMSMNFRDGLKLSEKTHLREN